MTENLVAKMMEDSEDMTATNDELSSIAYLARTQLGYMAVVADLTNKLDIATNELRKVQEELLPSAMALVGMSKFTMNDGTVIEVKDDIFASIRAEFVEPAMEWLENNGLGDIVKDEVKVGFGKGDLEKSKLLVAFCKSQKFPVTEKMSVHPMTFKATVKKELAKGVLFPDQLFSVGQIKKAKVTLPN